MICSPLSFYHMRIVSITFGPKSIQIMSKAINQVGKLLNYSTCQSQAQLLVWRRRPSLLQWRVCLCDDCVRTCAAVPGLCQTY